MRRKTLSNQSINISHKEHLSILSKNREQVEMIKSMCGEEGRVSQRYYFSLMFLFTRPHDHETFCLFYHLI